MAAPIPSANSHYISLDRFLDMKTRFAGNVDAILADPYQGKNILATAELFNVDSVIALANVAGCAAIRIYYGMDADLKVHAMLVAADEDSQDILPSAAGVIFEKGGDPPLLEEGQRCPPFCP
jgi:hypothetical protein